MEKTPSQRQTLKNRKMDENALTIICLIFTTSMSIASIYMYRGAKRMEDEGLEGVPPSQSMIAGGVFAAFISLILLLILLGVHPS